MGSSCARCGFMARKGRDAFVTVVKRNGKRVTVCRACNSVVEVEDLGPEFGALYHNVKRMIRQIRVARRD